MSLLAVENLRVVYSSASRAVTPWRRNRRIEAAPAVDGVSISVGRGEIFGVVGESGSGKSTVARCITGFITPTSGQIRLDGTLLGGRRSVSDRRRVQMVFQDPYSSLNPSMSVLQAIREPIAVHRLRPRGEIDSRAIELMRLVGLDPSLRHARPRQLSGGQRQRASIARALAVEPDILVADEPVSALDVSVQAVILNLLRDLRANLGMSIVFISHDLAVVSYLCDRVAVMREGRIVETGDADEVFANPIDAYTVELLASVPPHPWDAPNVGQINRFQLQENTNASSRH
ncbi:hypothetical protein B1R94_14380 [Mycolicibacterium litorale]|nr:hypothetical protein B1R94_14380 [Mycolicibacterium litorale]